MRHVISVLVENKFGVLARIAGLFSGRGFNIDTLNVGPTHQDGRSRITATLNGDEKALDQCIKQLDKLIDTLFQCLFISVQSHGNTWTAFQMSRTDIKGIDVETSTAEQAGDTRQNSEFVFDEDWNNVTHENGKMVDGTGLEPVTYWV